MIATVTKFQFNNMDEINAYIRSNQNVFFNYNELKDLLLTENVSFVLSGINRVQSTLLCEEGFSYVQQSQRYVPINDNFISLFDNTPEELKEAGSILINKSIILYTEMTELKDPNKKGRPSSDDFVHGISYEDARFILPLAISTNIVVSMSGDKLIDLIRLFFTYPLVFSNLRKQFEKLISKDLYTNLIFVAHQYTKNDIKYSDNYFKSKFNYLTLDNPVILLNTNNNVALSALASQNKESPDVIYDSWGENTEDNSKKLIKNVLGYNHTGINEHSRNTFGMICSLSTYHQVIRHRLQNIRREPLKNILFENDREYVIPDSINNNEYFREKVDELIGLYVRFYELFRQKYSDQFLMQYVLNAAAIKFVVSSNIRNDNIIFRDRLCYTAQEEIRKLYLQKFRILYDLYPELVVYGLPPCVTYNKCKEGKMKCGHIIDVIHEYHEFMEKTKI